VAAAAAGPAAWAAPAGTDIRGSGGPFAHTVRDGKWSQRTMTVLNANERARRVKGGFVCDDPAQGVIFYSRQVEIPPQALRRLDIAYRGDGFAPPQATTRNVSARIPITLYDADSGAKLLENYRTSILIQAHDTLLATIVAQTDEHDDNAYLEDLVERDLGEVRFTAASPSDMPTSWYGYDQADMVILTGLAAGRCQPSQVQALLDWVARGGTLVLSGSENLADVLAGRWGREAGVLPLGLHETTRLEVFERPAAQAPAGLSPGPAAPILLGRSDLDWPLTFTELEAVEAEVLYEADKLPVLTRRPVGDGQVLCLALPLSALRDKSLQPIWRHVAAMRNARPAVHGEPFASAGRQVLEQIAGRRGPGRLTAVGILLVPVVLVLVGGLALAGRRRGEWLWVVLVPLGLALAVGMYAYGKSSQEAPRLSGLALVSPAGQGRARIQQVAACYSGPVAREFDVRAGAPGGVVRNVSLAAAALSSGEVLSGPQMTVPAQVPANTTRAFFTEAVCPTGGIEGELTFSAEGVTGTLTNRLGQDVRNAVLLVNERTYRLGNLPAGAATEVRVNESHLLGRLTYIDPPTAALRPLDPEAQKRRMEEIRRRVREAQAQAKEQTTHPADAKGGAKVETRQAPPGPPARVAGGPPVESARSPSPGVPERGRTVQGDFTGALVRSSSDALRNRLVSSLVPAPTVGKPVSRQCTLIGYMPAVPLDVLDGLPIERQGWSVVAWPLTLTPPAPGSDVIVPAGFVDLEFPGSLIWDMMNRRFNPSFSRMDMAVAACPLAKLSLEAVTAKLTLRLSAIGYRLKVGGIVPSADVAGGDSDIVGVDRLGQRELIRRVDNANGVVEINIGKAERFRDARGRYLLYLHVERLNEPTSVEDMVRWQLESVDVSLEGTVRER